MSRYAVLFVVLVSVWMCCQASMSLITLPDAVTKMGAMCLDGSPAAYYFRPATKAENADKWVMMFQGGGWCYNEEFCAERTTYSRGSSDKMDPTLDCTGILGEDPNDNPDFFSWNHVEFAYCDGASFSGAADDPVVVNGKKIYFRGYYNLKAIFQDLLDNRGLNKATEVIVGGESAGGLSAFIHADQIAEMLPETVKRYKVAPMSGMFLRHANVNDEPVYEDQLRYVFAMQNASVGVDPHCLLAKSPMYMHLCMFGEETIKSTQTPIFVLNSMYDSWAMGCIMTLEPAGPGASQDGNCSAAPGWYNCMTQLSCSSEQWDEFNTKWADDFRNIINNNKGFQNPGNGLFAYSCYMHVAEVTGHWNKITVNGVTMREAFTQWYLSDNDPASKHTYVDCRIDGDFSCNPTCAA